MGGYPQTLMDKLHEPCRLHPLTPVGQTNKHNYCKKSEVQDYVFAASDL